MRTHFIYLKNSLTHNAIIKTVSFIIACGIWHALSQSYTIDTWLTVPLCFYSAHPDQQTGKQITAPEQIAIHLTGKRELLRTINLETLAVHINSDALHDGPNPINIQSAHLFLPETIKLLHYSPANIIITINSKQDS